jgi:hypothetical protein
VWLGCSQARAVETGGGLHVRVADDSCPSAALVRDKLEPLLDDDLGKLEVSRSMLVRPGVSQAAVRDLGLRYVVEIDGLRREIDDVARDCVERARVAAVFLALNMQPPAAQARRPGELRAGAQLLVEAVFAPQSSRGTAGGGLGVWLEYGNLHLDIALRALAPIDVPLRAEGMLQPSASLIRFPLALTASYLLEDGAWRVGPGLGIGLDLYSIDGGGAERPQTALRVNPGLLVAADLRLRLSETWSLALRVALEAVAKAYELRLDRSDSLGKTPRWWLSAGLSLERRFL